MMLLRAPGKNNCGVGLTMRVVFTLQLFFITWVPELTILQKQSEDYSSDNIYACYNDCDEDKHLDLQQH